MADAAQPGRSRILFVDDEQSVLDGLRRSLHRMRDSWEMTFVSSPEAAARLAAESTFDVVVADMRMPHMSGAELLEHVREVSPASVRLMLSGHSEVSAIMKSVGPSHQFLSKPCSGEQLAGAVRRACLVRGALSNPTLAATLGKIRALPSLPSIYQELVAALREEASMERIGDIIRRDVGLTAKVLQLVNSSYFGLPREVTDPSRAAALLGSDTISSLVLGLKLFESLPPILLPGMTPEQLTRAAAWTAAATRQLCALERVGDVFAAQAFIAGFLHDIGLLTLAAYAPELLARVGELAQRDGVDLADAELQVMGATHGDVGGYVAALWGFPDPVVEAILYHHCPSRSGVSSLAPLALVHVAHALAGDAGADPDSAQIDREYLAAIQVLDRLPEWLAAIGQLSGPSA
jgi:HD-like signal output (HDOD) protein/ActR/RegA family two-component response regulator